MRVFVKLVFVCARVGSLELIAVWKTRALESAAKTEVHARTEFAHALQDSLAQTAVWRIHAMELFAEMEAHAHKADATVPLAS